jgi:hypothetical protein
MVLLSDLCMKLVQHDKGGVLAAPERAELVVLVPRHRQEGVPPVHKVTLHKNALVIVRQCPGSGSVSHEVRIRLRIRIFLSSSKNSKKNDDSYCFVTFYL